MRTTAQSQVKAYIVDALAHLPASKVKVDVLRLLFGVRNERLHQRELARQSGLAVGTVWQELDRLTRLRMVESEADGNGSSTSTCGLWNSPGGRRATRTNYSQRCWRCHGFSSSETTGVSEKRNSEGIAEDEGSRGLDGGGWQAHVGWHFMLKLYRPTITINHPPAARISERKGAEGGGGRAMTQHSGTFTWRR